MNLFVALPYLSIALLVLGLIYRRVSRAQSEQSALRDLPEDLVVPLSVGGIIVALGPIVGFLVPGLVRVLVTVPGVMLLMEIVRLIGGLLFAWSLARLLVRGWQTVGSAGLAATARLVVTGLLLFLTVSGLYLSATVRWSSVWYVELVVPYLRSLATLHPDATLFAQAPLLVRLHVLGVFALVAVWPFARWTSDLVTLVRQLPRTLLLSSGSTPSTP